MTWVDVAGAAVANQELTKILISGPHQGLQRGTRRRLLSTRVGQKGVQRPYGRTKSSRRGGGRMRRSEEGVGLREWI